jgi:hypothetical protein
MLSSADKAVNSLPDVYRFTFMAHTIRHRELLGGSDHEDGRELFHLARTGGWAGYADHDFVATVGEHGAINILGAADCVGGRGSRRGSAMHHFFEGDADFVFVAGLFHRRIEKDPDQKHSSDNDNDAHLKSSVSHLILV